MPIIYNDQHLNIQKLIVNTIEDQSFDSIFKNKKFLDLCDIHSQQDDIFWLSLFAYYREPIIDWYLERYSHFPQLPQAEFIESFCRQKNDFILPYIIRHPLFIEKHLDLLDSYQLSYATSSLNHILSHGHSDTLKFFWNLSQDIVGIQKDIIEDIENRTYSPQILDSLYNENPNTFKGYLYISDTFISDVREVYVNKFLHFFDKELNKNSPQIFFHPTTLEYLTFYSDIKEKINKSSLFSYVIQAVSDEENNEQFSPLFFKLLDSHILNNNHLSEEDIQKILLTTLKSRNIGVLEILLNQPSFLSIVEQKSTFFILSYLSDEYFIQDIKHIYKNLNINLTAPVLSEIECAIDSINKNSHYLSPESLNLIFNKNELKSYLTTFTDTIVFKSLKDNNLKPWLSLLEELEINFYETNEQFSHSIISILSNYNLKAPQLFSLLSQETLEYTLINNSLQFKHYLFKHLNDLDFSEDFYTQFLIHCYQNSSNIFIPFSDLELKKCLPTLNKNLIKDNFYSITLSVLDTINQDLHNNVLIEDIKACSILDDLLTIQLLSLNETKPLLNRIKSNIIHPQLESIISFYILKNKYPQKLSGKKLKI